MLWFVRMGYKGAGTLLASRELRQSAIKKTNQYPSARKAQSRSAGFLAGLEASKRLFKIEFVGLNQCVRFFGGRELIQIPINAVEHAGMNIRQPGHEPIDGKR